MCIRCWQMRRELRIGRFLWGLGCCAEEFSDLATPVKSPEWGLRSRISLGRQTKRRISRRALRGTEFLAEFLKGKF